MKKIYFILALFAGFNALLAQSDKENQLLEKMNAEACGEINKMDFPPNEGADQVELKIGQAILPSFGKHKKEIMDVWGLDVDKAEDSQKVGEKMGAYMVFKCDKFQKVALQMASSGQLKDNGGPPDGPPPMMGNDEEVDGTIEKIEGTDVDFIYLKTSGGEVLKMAWLDKCEGSVILENYLKSKKSMHYKVRYRTQMLFQPKTKTYQSVKVISGILES